MKAEILNEKDQTIMSIMHGIDVRRLKVAVISNSLANDNIVTIKSDISLHLPKSNIDIKIFKGQKVKFFVLNKKSDTDFINGLSALEDIKSYLETNQTKPVLASEKI